MSSHNAALANDTNVQELFSMLKENDKNTSELTALLSYVKQMEDFLETAEGQISDMKAQISEMQEIQKHPIKSALQNACESLEATVTDMQSKLGKIREGIIEACKNAVASFKEAGITALDKLAGFFNVKQGLEAIQKDAAASMERCDKSIANVEMFAKESNTASLHIKNMARIVVGKSPVNTPKEMGKLAKAMCAPYKTEKKCLNNICKAANKAIAKLDELGKNANELRQERKTNSIDTHIASFEEKARQINEKAGKVLEFKTKQQDEVVV
jgi:hypothetical protein